MPDYSKGKIYTIRCRNDDSLIYVGSTIQPLSVRFGGHKSMSIKSPDRYVYQTINNDWDSWYIELYENYPCNNKEELCKKEGEIIRLIGTLNKNIEGRTRKEYRIDNADKIKNRGKKYYIDNADKIQKYNKEYYINNTDEIKKKYKKYCIDNADKIKNKRKEYRINNANKLKKHCDCVCGGHYTFKDKSQHLKTKKHQEYLSTLVKPFN